MNRLILAVSLLCFTSAIKADDRRFNRPVHNEMVRIEVGNDDSYDSRENERYMKRIRYDYRAHRYANKRLRKRVRQLESAVRQLQDEVYKLRNTARATVKPSQFVCSLSTKRKGTFIGKASTRLEAKVIAERSCQQEISSFWCEDANLECEKDKT